jgi:hypothetical protein
MRRCALWISVVSFVLTAICIAVVSFIERFYLNPQPATPGSNVYKLFSGTVSQIFEAASLVVSIALPVGLISVSVYMLQTERILRALGSGQGFEVVTAPQTRRDA